MQGTVAGVGPPIGCVGALAGGCMRNERSGWWPSPWQLFPGSSAIPAFDHPAAQPEPAPAPVNCARSPSRSPGVAASCNLGASTFVHHLLAAAAMADEEKHHIVRTLKREYDENASKLRQASAA